MRNLSYIQELSPVCVKIQNVSTDFYPAFRSKKNNKTRELEAVIGLNSSDLIKSQNSEPITIRRIQYSGLKCQNDKLPYIHGVSRGKKYDFARSGFNNTSPLVKKFPSEVEKSRKNNGSQVSSPKISLRSKSITKVAYKDAARSNEWSLISRPELDQMWRSLINLSNGIKILEKKHQFKYFIGKGNNSELIRRLMTVRNSWTATENWCEANFIWTQWKDKKICESLASASELHHEIDPLTRPNLSYKVPVRIKEIYRQVDLADLGFYRISSSSSFTVMQTSDFSSPSSKLYNKIEVNQYLANKKGLYKSLKFYYESLGLKLFTYHPITFHVKQFGDLEFEKFSESFAVFEKRKMKKKGKNIWIVKPGENSNRGRGIKVCKNLQEIKEVLRDNSEQNRTSIVQKYMEKPFLLHGRKFDIRCFALITCINGVLQGYFYVDGYIRTSCAEFSLKDTENNYIHLTNDAIQKHSEDYGKFEDNNKLSYKELQRYLDQHHSDKKLNFFSNTLPQIKNIVKDTIQAVFLKIDPNRRRNSMEIFGYDFMLDHKLKPWIIEVNTNPCLELSSSYLSYLIPAMVENALRISLDSNFPSGVGKNQFEPLAENRFELIFHELVDGVKIREIVKVFEDSEVSDVQSDS
jgi:tubulin polyglutamylase TTLL1/tubulin monoglycylase TTLL3/8